MQSIDFYYAIQVDRFSVAYCVEAPKASLPLRRNFLAVCLEKKSNRILLPVMLKTGFNHGVLKPQSDVTTQE
jgi:hypothetical protein